MSALLNFEVISDSSTPVAMIAVSSVYRKVSVAFETLGGLFIFIMKSRGPRMEPRGTPQVAGQSFTGKDVVIL